MTDVDGLKRINDTAGHLAGDQALAIMGKVLRQATRSTDLAGRYGGDEFAIVLPQTRSEDAERVGQRILNFLQDQGWIQNTKRAMLIFMDPVRGWRCL